MNALEYDNVMAIMVFPVIDNHSLHAKGLKKRT